MQISTDIYSLFVLVLAVFTMASTFLSAYSILNVIRLRNVRMSWNAGKMAGYPIFSTIFLGIAFFMGMMVYLLEYQAYFTIVGCYAWIGFNWFVASYLASKRYITDHGIVKNINDPSQTVAWHQMTDYVVRENRKGSLFVFIYQKHTSNGRKSKRCIRLELHVPAMKLEEFNKIVSLKLGKTISPSSEMIFNVGKID